MRTVQNPIQGLTLVFISLIMMCGSDAAVAAEEKKVGTVVPATVAPSTQAIDSIAVVVNDEVITRLELAERLRSTEIRMKMQNMTVPPQADLQRQVLESMIIERVQLQKAKENGITIDDAMLDRAVGKIAEQNKMTLQQLRDQVEKEGTYFDQFRNEMREEIIIQRLRQSSVDTKISVSDAEVDNYLAAEAASLQEKTELNLAQILVRIPENSSSEQIAKRRARAEEALAQLKSGIAFEKIAASYSDSSDALTGGQIGWRSRDKLPQLFNDATAKLKPGEISALIKSASGFFILKVIDQRVPAAVKAADTPTQQTHARHILIKVNQLMTSYEVQRKMLEIKGQLDRKEAKFEDLAKQFSADSTATKGGDIGWIYPGDMVPEFEKAMDALKIGQVSEPIESPFGFHLIEVLERKSDDVSKQRKRTAARQALRERKAEEQAQEQVGQLRDRAYIEYRTEDK